MITQVEQIRGEYPAGDEQRAPGTVGARKRSARITPRAASPTRSVVQSSASSESTQEDSSRQALSPSADVPVSFGSSPITTSTAAPARNPVITGLERNRAIHPIRSTASRRKRTPVRRVIAVTSSAAWSPARPVISTAPPATAARDELGPVEIWRDVQKSA